MKDKQYVVVTKIFFASIAQFITFFIALFLAIKILEKPELFFVPLDREVENLTGFEQAQRAWCLFFASIYGMMTIYLFYKCFSLDNKNKWYYILTLSLVPLVNVLVSLIIIIKKRIDLIWWKNIKKENDVEYMLSFYNFCKIIFRNKTFYRKKFILNVLAYLLLMFCLLAFVMNMIVFEKNDDVYDLNNYYIFIKWTYFTQLTNTICFFYTLFFLIFKNSKIVRNNNLKVLLLGHIVVVGSIYLFILLPGSFIIDLSSSNVKWYNIVSPLNQHVVVPILFAIVFVWVMKIEKTKSFKFIYSSWKGTLYPTWYALYVYSISFVCRYSPYYVLTNVNSQMSLFDSNAYGSFYNVLYFVPVILYFNLWFFVFWIINMRFCSIPFKQIFKKYII